MMKGLGNTLANNLESYWNVTYFRTFEGILVYHYIYKSHSLLI